MRLFLARVRVDDLCQQRPTHREAMILGQLGAAACYTLAGGYMIARGSSNAPPPSIPTIRTGKSRNL